MRKKFRPERKGINDNWRHPVDDPKDPGNSRTSNVEPRQDSTRFSEKHSGENNHGNLKRNGHSGTNNRNSTKRNSKHEEKKNNSEGEKGGKRSGNEGNYMTVYCLKNCKISSAFHSDPFLTSCCARHNDRH